MATLLPEAEGVRLGRTLESGQAFRWKWDTEGRDVEIAVGIVGRRVLRLAQDARGLWLLSPDTADARESVLRYLGASGDATSDIRRVEAGLAEDPVLARILPHTRGIGLLAQDPWEVLISFIISANNNIPKIIQSIDRLARAVGEPLDGVAYAFPTPDRLAAAHPRTLAACLLGYRAPYVRAAARLVAEQRIDLGGLARIPPDEAREHLLGIRGVGVKVADCIALFGLRHTGAFPVDVWIRRAVERLYFRGRQRTVREIQAFARGRFGPLAGYAQQHLFAYARSHIRRVMR